MLEFIGDGVAEQEEIRIGLNGGEDVYCARALIALLSTNTHGSLIFWTKSQIEKSAILPRKQGFCEHAA